MNLQKETEATENLRSLRDLLFKESVMKLAVVCNLEHGTCEERTEQQSGRLCSPNSDVEC